MLHQYLYVSTAPDMSREVLEDVLRSCSRNNERRNITGLLVYNGRNFMQLLEGAMVDLLWVMRRISADGRHSGLSVLEEVPIVSRACPDWTMRYIPMVDDVADRRAALDADLPGGLDPAIRRILLNFSALN